MLWSWRQNKSSKTSISWHLSQGNKWQQYGNALPETSDHKDETGEIRCIWAIT